jgi:hypothetical protein
MDERFLVHQMKSMKLATRVGAVLIGALILFRLYGKGYFDWQLCGIVFVMAVVKVATMIYLRRAN